MDAEFDFSGYATRNDLLCGDGRIIRRNAFKDNDGATVPLIWNHDHTNPDAVLGHALLENRDDGVYAYCKFNDTEAGQNAKKLVMHGDVRSLSICANKLKQIGNDVIHGMIRELSLVLAGCNPGATIDYVMTHSDENEIDSIIVNYDESALVLYHSDMNNEKGEPEMAEESKTSVEKLFESLTEDQKKSVLSTIEQMKSKPSEKEPEKPEKPEDTKEEMKHSEKETAAKPEEEETIDDVLKTLSEKQQKAVYATIGMILEDNGIELDDEEDDEIEGGKTEMKHNVFDQETNTENADVLTHAEMLEIFEDAKKPGIGSMREAMLQHGITNIDYLFPDAQTIDKTPGFIKRDDTWVTDVMNAVHKSPFSRIKSVFADITEADARAKGYIKGKLKTEEVFSLLKRVTTPTTVYKKQKLDRDDVIDITDFDVVAWLKAEMRMMLDEEIARAILVGDGRSSSSNDKINEQNIRPIWTDDEVYTVKAEIPVTDSTTNDEKAKAFIKSCIKSRKEYKGSGNPVMYMSEDMLTDCLLLEDTNQRIIYDSVEKLATALRVRKIVPVPVMENLTRTVESKTHTLAGIYVNLADYNIGADKGGAVNMFDDFDIDYNQMKYLIETRCSGALIKPYAAVALEFVKQTS